MILRKDGLYQESITIDGKRKYFYGHEPKEVLKKIALYKGDKVIKKSRTLKEAAEDWERIHFEVIKHYTAESYRAPLRDVKEEFGKFYVHELEPLVIQRFLDSLARKELSQQTVKLRLIVLRQILDTSVMRGEISVNPCAAVRVSKNLPQQKGKAVSDEVIKKIKGGLDHKFGLYPFLIMFSGLRREEALALTWDDINFDNNYINVDKVVEFWGNNPHIRESTKSQTSTRAVTLIKCLKDELLKAKPEGAADSDHIFNREGKLLNSGQFRRLWASYCKYIGVETSSHPLRHTFATMLYYSGVAVKDAQEEMGHARVEMLLDTYTTLDKKKKSKNKTKMDKYTSKL